MKKIFSALRAKAGEPEFEKKLVILLPVFALIIAALIITPQLKVYIQNRSPSVSPAVTEPPAAAADEDSAADMQLYISAYSENEDMFISVCGEDGVPVTGVRFQLSLVDDNGDEIICSTYTDGSCYLVELAPTIYTVSMSPQDGYKTAEPVECVVSSLTHQAPSLEQLVPGLNDVNGKLYYLSEHGELASAIGLDLSCYNGRIEWDILRERGLDFLILRLGGRGWGSGLLYTDTRFREYFNEAKKAGFDIGVYFYSTATSVSEAVDEAKFVISTLGGAPLEMPVFLDCEYSGNYPNGRADKLTIYQRAEIISAFSTVIRSAGYESGLYSGTYFIDTEIDPDSLSQQSVWIANYTANNALPRVDFPYELWQYTESGKVRGVFGYVDINVLFR